MPNVRYLLRFALLLVTCASFTGCVSIVGRAVSDHDPDKLVTDAEAAFDTFLHDPNQTWMKQNLGHAKAVLIAPRVVRAGFMFGGSGGRAVLLAKEGNAWRGPAFYNLATVTVGFQAGVDVAEVVLVVMTDKGLKSLMSDAFKLGGDVNVAAGPVGAGAQSTVTADIVAFTRDKGVYGGVNVEGSMISPDAKRNAEYYGRANVTPPDILVRNSVSNRSAAPLVAAVTRATR